MVYKKTIYGLKNTFISIFKEMNIVRSRKMDKEIYNKA